MNNSKPANTPKGAKSTRRKPARTTDQTADTPVTVADTSAHAKIEVLLDRMVQLNPPTWTHHHLLTAAADEHISPTMVSVLLPYGTLSLAQALFARHDTETTNLLTADFPVKGIKARVLHASNTRFQVCTPHLTASRSAARVLLARAHMPTLLKTSHTIWNLAAPPDSRFSHYTKRLTLAGVFASVIPFWLTDESPNQQETLALLERQMDRFTSTMARIKPIQPTLERLAETLARARYPTPAPKG